MSTAQLTEGRGRGRSDAVRLPAAATWQAPAAPSLVCAALLVVVLYAAFAHGGVTLGAGTRIELAVAAVAAAASAAWLWRGALRPAIPRLALTGVVLLAAFACWNGITVLWSVAPDQTWIALNRVIAYVTVLAVALLLGGSDRRVIEVAANGFLAVALAVTAYAVGQKLLPGVHIGGLVNLNQTGPLPRLQLPLDYWNALALFLVLAVPIAISLASDPLRGLRVRLLWLCATSVMLLTIAFTYSRGGLIALVVGLVVAAIMSGQWLRWLAWLAAAVLGAVPSVAVGLASGPLTTAGTSLGQREGAGLVLLYLLAGSSALLVFGGRRLTRLDPKLRIDAARAPQLRRYGLGLAGLVIVGVLVAMTLSSRGLTGTVSHAWNSFAATHAPSNYNPRRLLSAASQNRWVWWKEAAGAFSARPVGGWGAGSFGVVHLLYRHNTLTIQQPHSVPLEFLSDTGVVGAVLAVGGYVLLLVLAFRAVARMPESRQRLAAAALLAGATAYAVHSIYDWDWDIPAVTLPALLFLGLVAGAERSSEPADTRRALGHPRLGLRALGLAGLTLWLGLFAISADLPELAASRASAALVQASSDSPRALAAAQSAAAQSARLDPLSDAGPLAEATIALHRGQVVLARSYIVQAVRRDPTDEGAWAQLSYVDELLGDRPGVVQASQRIIDLDPRGKLAHYELVVQLFAAPPTGSPTAIPTPAAGGGATSPPAS